MSEQSTDYELSSARSSERRAALGYLGDLSEVHERRSAADTDVLVTSFAQPDTYFLTDEQVGSGLGAAARPLARLARSFPKAEAPAPRSEFRMSDRYDGVVVSIDHEAGVFAAKFADAESTSGLTADFLIDEVDEDDLELLRPGALFYVILGKVRVEWRWQPTSTIRFRRVPPIRDERIAEALERGAKARAKFSVR